MPNLSELQIEAKLQLDLEDTARRIEYEFADYLAPAPKGIYVINKVEPVMVDGTEYYTLTHSKDNKIVRTPISDITKITSSIYTAAIGTDKLSTGPDKLVIPKMFMLNKPKYIGNKPVMAYRGLKIVNGLINNQIDNFVKYRKVNKTESSIVKNNLIELPSEDLTSTTSRINELYEDIYVRIREFMGMHDWHLYFVKSNQAKLVIEKSIDYRALQWLILEEEKATINAR